VNSSDTARLAIAIACQARYEIFEDNCETSGALSSFPATHALTLSGENSAG
jgi:hypothetical protein